MLNEPEPNYLKLFESMRDGLVSLDMCGRIRGFNSAYQNMLGYSDEELRRLTSVEITPERWHPLEAQIARDQIMTRGYSDVYEKEYRRKDGTTFPVELRSFLLRDNLGEPCGIGAIVRDLTEDYKREQAVRENEERLRVAMLSGLLGTLSHDLSQPLAAIIANANAAKRFLARGAIDLDELQAIYDDISADGERAARFIQTIRSMLPKGIVQRQPIQLNDLIKDTLVIARHRMAGTDAEILLDLHSSLPSLEGDPVLLQQLLLSLLSNAFDAIKTSERPGRVTLRTRGAEGEAALDVIDSGTGIPVDKMEAIFAPFVTTNSGRLGMGLALCRSIAIGHEGRIWAENNSGGDGATFHLTLPLRKSVAPSWAQTGEITPTDNRQTLTVLVADDNASFRRAVSSILAPLPGLEPLAEAADGAEAVAKAAELKPDLVLLDMSLPGIHGVEAASRIRELASNARILFLSQYDSPDFVEAALRAGAQGYVLKIDAGTELLEAAKAILRGEQYTSSGIRRVQK